MVSGYSGRAIVNPDIHSQHCADLARRPLHTVDLFVVFHKQERIVIKIAEESDVGPGIGLIRRQPSEEETYSTRQ